MLRYNLGMGLILASASPRRSELLRKARMVFRVEPAHVPEVHTAGEDPKQYAQRLARDKARAVAAKYPNDFVIGADTIVVADAHVLEKPADEADAARMIRMLSGHTHEVTTGVCLCGPNVEIVETETTRVTVAEISDEEIADYIHTGEPMDKAGAYGIQGMFSRWVTGIEGDYFNVVGLPIARVYRMMRRAGVL
ncbi:maf protein [Candidatus Koribacter versatilis Ellin345]|uniref:dTTP/UTP pyrophosphatase n=1 Tax=Koribacter versatilis (strain Ellin345) TaxID=204669 RepID=NTPPA_KORVE|nr:Maf family protein [Candidatus Koribacter versatilis]Q1IV55.1 RecName: Full=dTTP/UTP pyrophosphatase; Short=dTTPase/UTPase; AltName: Full=Nucleoside triphosphate pyrophosphatase; AltName: Full=Nucleotide pyrophosphatase; Short=Nucleotide PPase [Candidatus Koribacter versatilis Ellin345]ABF39245.1 maf protein [Candidatus Koribacter versatilis Ellin345]